MAKIVFAWELGAGMGHILPHVSLIKHLRGKGHEVNLIVRDLVRSLLLAEKYGLACFQSPMMVTPLILPVRIPCTYAHILYNNGFRVPGILTSMVRGWCSLFDALKPDLVIFDHSPTALLAARAYSFKKILVGTGFCLPPPVYPLPDLRPWLRIDPSRLKNDEDRILKVINNVMKRYGLEPLDNISTLYTDGPNLLRTVKELDPYRDQRGDCDYLGTWTEPVGEEPQWPAGSGKRVFVYLKPFPALPALLKTLGALNLPTIVYIDEPDRKPEEKFLSSTLKVARYPQDMNKIAAQCDLAVLNGSHDTTLNLLLAGKPTMHLPIYLEQYLTASTVERLGAGMNIPELKPEGIAIELKRMLETDSYSEAARKFADNYAHLCNQRQKAEVIRFVEGALT